MKILKVWSVGLCLLLIGSAGLSAQRIGIGEEPEIRRTQPESGQSQAEGASASSRRIIPPEEFGKFKSGTQKEGQLSRDALVRKLRADSAAMRIRFQEKFKRLRRQIRNLKTKLRRLTGDTVQIAEKQELYEKTGGQESVNGKERESTKPGTKRTEPEPQRASGSGQEPLSENTRLNPNTASLEDLKSIPDLSNRLAERIDWYRSEITHFENRTDLTRVPGIDRQVFRKIKRYFHKGSY